MAEYAKAAYWDDRYTQDPETFEWFQSYSGIAHILKQYINDKSRVLVVGCGNSRKLVEIHPFPSFSFFVHVHHFLLSLTELSENIYTNLTKKVVSIDISEVR